MKQCYIEKHRVKAFHQQHPMYSVVLVKGKGRMKIDINEYDFSGAVLLCSTPYQSVQLKAGQPVAIRALQFHGDYYCIEHHKKEVACNGLLFNNIYQSPFINLNRLAFDELHQLFDKMEHELKSTDAWSQAVARSYLQLVLAIGSKTKAAPETAQPAVSAYHPVLHFKPLLETYFKNQRQPAFYAAALHMPVNTFSKNCKQYFGRSPSALIHERVILEAKKQIHLTHKSIKEIASILHFEDEHYFSRYFKKHTGVSPTMFREKVGISIVADLSS